MQSVLSKRRPGHSGHGQKSNDDSPATTRRLSADTQENRDAKGRRPRQEGCQHSAGKKRGYRSQGLFSAGVEDFEHSLDATA